MNLRKTIFGFITFAILTICLFPGFRAGAFVLNTYRVAEGSRFTIFNNQAGVDVFFGKPTVYVAFSGDDSRTRSVKVVGPQDYPVGSITCEWTSSKTPPGTYKLWVLARKNGVAEKPVLVSDSFFVQPPVITGIQRDSSDPLKVIVSGRYFGAGEPLIRLSYPHPDNEGMLETIVCRIFKPLAFPGGDEREGKSCMDVHSSESRLVFFLPQGLPHGVIKTVYLQNRAGNDSAVVRDIERDDVVLEISASPQEGGATNPEGSITVNLNEQLEIAAMPNPGFRFVRWDTREDVEILNGDLLNAVVFARGNGSITAVFEAVEMEFGGIRTAGASIIEDPNSGSIVSNANLTWESAYSASTPASQIKYHVYKGETDNIGLLLQEANRVKTLVGVTEATVALEPVSGAVYYFLVVAEDKLGNLNNNHRPVRVENLAISFRKRIKDVAGIVSDPNQLSLSEDEKVLTLKNGDFWSSFAKDDIVLFHAEGKQFMAGVELVYLDGDDTILWVAPVTFDDVIESGEWSGESHTPDSQDAGWENNRSFFGRVDFGQGATAYGKIILEGLTVGFKTKFPPGSNKVAQAWLKGTLGFKGRLKLGLRAGANNNPGASKGFLSGKVTSYRILDGKKLKTVDNLIVDLFLDFKTEKAVNFVQSLEIKKKIDVLIEIHSDETCEITDKSDKLVFNAGCTANNFSDMDIYFAVKPRVVSSLLDKDPDYAKISLGIEQKIRELKNGWVGYGQFDIKASGSSEYSYSAKNFWWPTEYHTKHFSGEPMEVFSLPVVALIGSVNDMEIDTTEEFVMYWKDGINNAVHEWEVIWSVYHSDESASSMVKVGPVIKTEDGYKRTLYFKPHTPGQWTISMTARGDGLLRGDLGFVFDSVLVDAYDPEE